MNSMSRFPVRTALCASLLSVCWSMSAVGQTTPDALAAPAVPALFTFSTVANSVDVMPNSGGRLFSSFNQPSVSTGGWVVLRARSKGGQGAGEPLRGIFSRQMAGRRGPIQSVFDSRTTVPQPNNTLYDGELGTFTEFPAFPRIGLDSTTVATRAQSKPVWTYTAADGTETRTGTSGVYTLRLGERISAMAQLGAVAGFGYFSVPGAAPGTKFDQFPGAPAVAGANMVAFKGNYTDGVSKTGIFFRAFSGSATPAATQVVASSDTLIPGQLAGGVRFGSTAPPSASSKHVVFLGLDNEDAPSLGGIYLAPLATTPALQALATIGGQVPGESPGVGFTRLGEALSFDGRYVAFWGAWGSAVRSITLNCPADGQADIIAFCVNAYPNGYTTTVPALQGVFVHDVQTRKTYAASKTGSEFVDYVYWVFSGRPPGVGDADSEDFEPPRWRSSAFVATYGSGGSAQVVFKARRTTVPAIDGLYLAVAPTKSTTVSVIAETGWGAQLLDPLAPGGAKVTALGVERDGLRNGWLAISASMLDPITSESWAGVYVTRTAK